jgi:hypothetical protein
VLEIIWEFVMAKTTWMHRKYPVIEGEVIALLEAI